MKCLGIDIGGTFTDLIIVDSELNRVILEKVSSTPRNQSDGARNGILKFQKCLKTYSHKF